MRKVKIIFSFIFVLLFINLLSLPLFAFSCICFNCNSKISSSTCSKCSECNWYICEKCNACKFPSYGKCNRYIEYEKLSTQKGNTVFILLLIISLIIYLFLKIKNIYQKKKQQYHTELENERIAKLKEKQKKEKEEYQNQLYKKYNIVADKNGILPDSYEITSLINNLLKYGITYDTNHSFKYNKKIFLLAEKSSLLDMNYNIKLKYKENFDNYKLRKKELKEQFIHLIKNFEEKNKIKNYLKYINYLNLKREDLLALAIYYSENTNVSEILAYFNSKGYHYAKIIYSNERFYVINEKGFNETIYNISDKLDNFLKY